MRKILSILSMVFCLISVSCNKSDTAEVAEDENDGELKTYIDNVMGHYYWWYAQMPSATWNKDALSYFESKLFSKDNWSWATTGEEWREMQTGTSSGSFGAVYGQPIDGYDDYRIYVKYVYHGSAFEKAGITRGWRLDKIGGYEVTSLIKSDEGIRTLNNELSKSSNSFVFTDTGGVQHSMNISMTSFSTDSYLYKTVFDSVDFPGLTGKVGYFNYWTFNSYLSGDIDEAIEEFKREGIRDLIIDLRYNSGGNGNVSARLASYIVPKEMDGKCFYTVTHNDKNHDLDEETDYAVTDSSLELSRVFFIIGSATASASEVLINGLRDALGKNNVIMVGKNSYGKANGMYGFAYPHGDSKDNYYDSAEYVFLPICFYDVNRAGESIPEDGFTPDHSCPDDLYHDWGAGETLTKACLSYIATGDFGTTKTGGSKNGTACKGIRLPMPEDNPQYGTFICERRY